MLSSVCLPLSLIVMLGIMLIVSFYWFLSCLSCASIGSYHAYRVILLVLIMLIVSFYWFFVFSLFLVVHNLVPVHKTLNCDVVG